MTQVANLSGDFSLGLEVHKAKSASQTFGQLRGARNSSPENYLKKRTGIMGNHDLPPSTNAHDSVRNFSYDCTHKRERVPRSIERPVHGLKSGKDFVIANAVEAILSTPKQSPKTFDWTKRKGYGRNPEYLDLIKQTLNSEYRLLQTMHQ